MHLSVRVGLNSRSRRSAALALALALAGALLVAVAGPSAAGPADLDATFATNGVSIVGSPAGDFAAVALQPDGKLVAAGGGWPGSTSSDFQVVRYLPDGRLDPTFGGDGRVFTDFGAYDHATALALQPDGKIVVLGNTFESVYNIIPTDWVTARYNPDGTLDDSFGTGGYMIKKTAYYEHSYARSIALQPDGKMLIAGNAEERVTVIRLNGDGSLDRTFSPSPTGGEPGLYVGAGHGESVAVQPSGRIVVSWSGPTIYGVDGGVAVRRFLPDGAVDPTFGSSGETVVAEAGSTHDMALRPDGSIVLVGSPSRDYAPQFTVTGLTADGALDPSFGRDGRVARGIGDAQNVYAGAVGLGPDGSLTVAGWASAGPGGEPWIPHRVFVAHLSAGGTFDAGFGTDGIATYLVGDQPGTYVEDVVVQPDGKPVAVGFSPDPQTTTYRAFALRLAGPAAPLSLRSPYSAWTQPASTPLDGTATWIATANDPHANPGQLPAAYSYVEVFGFSNSSALGVVGLVTDPTGKFAVFSVVESNGTKHSVAVPLDWQANRFYLPFVYRAGPGLWGAWVYDHSAARWVVVGALSLPTEWGKLSPWSVTTALWHGPPGKPCTAYPAADVFFHPPIGYVGSTASVARSTATGTNPGDCPTTSSVESTIWHRYRLGAAQA